MKRKLDSTTDTIYIRIGDRGWGAAAAPLMLEKLAKGNNNRVENRLKVGQKIDLQSGKIFVNN